MKIRGCNILPLGLTVGLYSQTTSTDQSTAVAAGVWRAELGRFAWTALLKTDGPRLIGVVTYCGGPGAGPIEIHNGSVMGTSVAFKCTSANGERTIAFTGTLKENEIALTWDVRLRDGAEPIPADSPLFGSSFPKLFVAKRVTDAATVPDALREAASHVRAGPRVTFDRITRADQEPQNWLTYSGSVLGRRHSALTHITPANVNGLALAWLWQAPSRERVVATPLVADGVMYMVQPPNDVMALDAATGRVLWKFAYVPTLPGFVCCGRDSRGLAMLGDTLFMGTLDAHVIAIDAYSGKLIWNATVANAADPACNGGVCYAIVHAPLVVKDKVIVGTAGGDTYQPGVGIRGFIAALDSRTGKEVWRFHTVPAPGEAGNETWSGESWKTGGAGVWNTGAYDPDLNLTYWGTGNPAPTSSGTTRLGDNLYSESVVALDADTGALKWHYQFTPHDENDRDSAQIPVLADVQWQGRPRKIMLWANKNGLMYVFDRATGQFLMGTPFGEVNWMDGFDGKGRPVLIAKNGSNTATDWFPFSYSPTAGLFYFPVRQPTNEFRGAMYGAIRAFDPITGSQVWEFRKNNAAFAGVLTTASDLLFTGCADPWGIPRQFDCEFLALNYRTGQLLWQMPLPGSVRGGPMTYAVAGKQFVAAEAGNTLFVFGLRQ